MRPDDRDIAHLWDMLSAAREALSYISRVPEEDYLRDRMRQRALERTIEVLGEAAGRVSEEAKLDLASIEWRRIVGQRIVLAHRYSKVDHAMLYKTTREKVPALVERLENLLQDTGQQ